MTSTEIWAYRDPTFTTSDFTGYSVEALDGGIGKIDEATSEVGASYLVVDTGPWIFGKKVLLPAGVIDRIDVDERKIYVQRTKDEIKNAPEFDEERFRDDPQYREEFSGYYTALGTGRAEQF